ncbi:MAG: hypothetical protein U0797_19855 [Gemmataceae bacterium]
MTPGTTPERAAGPAGAAPTIWLVVAGLLLHGVATDVALDWLSDAVLRLLGLVPCGRLE